MRAGGNVRWVPAAAASLAAVVLLGACGGGGERQDADEPRGSFTVRVTQASFPSEQRLAEPAEMVIAVRNVGSNRVPNVAVTLKGATGSGSATTQQGQDAFGYRDAQPDLADPVRPIWILDTPPDQRTGPAPAGERLENNAGGGVTAYVNTWALGPLRPGQEKRFTWGVVPVRPGTYSIDWRVNAGLDGKAIAKLPNGRIPEGSFDVTITGEPRDTTVDEDGDIVPEQ